MENTQTSRKEYGQQVRQELAAIRDTSELMAGTWASKHSQFVTEMHNLGQDAAYTAKRVYFKVTGWKA